MCDRIGDLTETFGTLIYGLGTEIYPSAAEFIRALNLRCSGQLLIVNGLMLNLCG